MKRAMTVLLSTTVLSTAALLIDAAGYEVLHQDWESGIGNWYVTNGVWEVGAPMSGPWGGHNSINCAATDLDGNYPGGSNTRLVSPYTDLPGIVGDERIRVRFWHWSAIENGYDQGMVQVSVGGGGWQTISEVEVDGSGVVWSPASADLTPYAGSTIRLAFYFTSDGIGNYAGWYIDDVSIVVGAEVFENPEDFESGIGDWSADNGLWELGTPTDGPPGAHSGASCFGTAMSGAYAGGANTRLISPRLALPEIQPWERIRVRFWQWFAIENGYDQGMVQVSVEGGVWQTVSEVEVDGSGVVWTNAAVDLTAFAGSTVRLAFYFTSDGIGNYAGWYIDDVSIVVGPELFRSPEDFESGIGDWSVDNGLWELGTPAYGPSGAHSGANCFGTVLSGNYAGGANTRLISPRLYVLSGQGQYPGLYFWHWFQIEGGYDNGYVQVATEGGPWITVAGPFTGEGPQWTQGYADLLPYQGATIRIGFLLTSDNIGVRSGWYVDDVRIEGVVPAAADDDCCASPTLRVWPNPFDNRLSIHYSIPRAAPVRIALYDVCGRQLPFSAHTFENAGVHVWNVDLTHRPAGVYYLKARIGGTDFTRSCIKVR